MGCKQEIEKDVDVLIGADKIRAGKEAEKDLAIAKCKELFQREQSGGIDFSKGPCLSQAIIPNWVCDVAHNPREDVDDKLENQCSAFREGKAEHFVELDLGGNLIKTY